MYSYINYTLNSPNPLRRYSHRHRIKKSVDTIVSCSPNKILDFGAGTNTLQTALGVAGFKGIYLAYDPLAPIEYQFFNNFNDITDLGNFDLVTCFEVLEHFNSKTRKEYLAQMATALTINGKLIISVPVELGPVSFVKNLMRIRLFRKQYSGISTINILRSLFFLPIISYRLKNEFLSHMGFDYRHLLEEIKYSFMVLKIEFSPLNIGTHWLNSQVFITAQKKKLSN